MAYIGNYRITNTSNMRKYLNNRYQKEKVYEDKKTQMSNEIILGLRKTRGISLKHFEKKFNVKIEDLTDIRKIKIDKNQPQSKRQAQFLKQVGNPYMLRRGSVMIKVSFANNGLSMEQAFENLLLNV